jgi:hypothetical protein
MPMTSGRVTKVKVSVKRQRTVEVDGEQARRARAPGVKAAATSAGRTMRA